MREKLITIATFSQPIEADLVKSKLESENIECFIADQNVIQWNWLYSNAVGGIKVQVRESDAKRALEVIKSKSEELDFSEKDAKIVTLKCPKCNSSTVTYEKFAKKILFISWLFLGIPLPFLKRKYRCIDCGYEWKETRIFIVTEVAK